MFVTMLPATKSESIPTSSSSCYPPPNDTSIMQPLDQGIILSAKRRYKKKLAERYLACVENNKDANSLPFPCSSNKHDCCILERNLLHHHPELFSQSRVQTPCNRPCTYNRGSSTCPSTRCVEQGSKVVR